MSGVANIWVGHYRLQIKHLLILLFTIIIIAKLNPLNFYSIELDEIESINSAWLIHIGHIPYVDFFQHHQPLLWYALQPCFLFGTSHAIFLSKLILLVTGFLMIFIVHKISKEMGLDGNLAVMLLLANGIFMYRAFDIKPDVAGVFFAILSIYFSIKFAKLRNKNELYFSGFFAVISFLFSLKLIFFFIFNSLFIVFVCTTNKKNVASALSTIMHYILVILAVILVFIVFFIPNASIYYKSLFVFNSAVNGLHIPELSLLLTPATQNHLYSTILLNGLLILTTVLIIIYNIINNKNVIILYLSFLAIFYIILWFFSATMSMYNLLIPVIVSPILILEYLKKTSKLQRKVINILLLVIVVLLLRNSILVFYDPPSVSYTTNDLGIISSVLSIPSDHSIYCDHCLALLHEKNCYIWFGTRKIIREASLLFDHEPCKLEIKEKPTDFVILDNTDTSKEFRDWISRNYNLINTTKNIKIYKLKVSNSEQRYK